MGRGELVGGAGRVSGRGRALVDVHDEHVT